VTPSTHANRAPSRIQGQNDVDKIPLPPPAEAGFNGLLSAPTDPSTNDASEATFDRWAFHQVADFWTPLMTQVGLQTGTSTEVTFQPVDATNNPVPCASSDKQNEPGMLNVTKIGPFYCRFNGAGKRVIYWPLQSIFTLNGRTIPSYGAFAEAEVIAHEFVHYMQDIANILARVTGYGLTTSKLATTEMPPGGIRNWSFRPIVWRELGPVMNGTLICSARVTSTRRPQSPTLSAMTQSTHWFYWRLPQKPTARQHSV